MQGNAGIVGSSVVAIFQVAFYGAAHAGQLHTYLVRATGNRVYPSSK